MGPGQRPRDRQTEPEAAVPVQGDERLEGSFEDISRQAAAVVDHPDRHGIGRPGDADLHALLRLPPSVVEQAVENLGV